MLSKLRQAVSTRLPSLIDGAEIGALLLGGGVSVVFGKLLAAGVATRFFRRRAEWLPVKPLPLWIPVISGVLALIESAIIVESINLPFGLIKPDLKRAICCW
jgi:hypothetical protein